MRRIALLLVLAAALGAPAAWAATTHEVAIRDNFYEPSSLTIPAGDTVRWTNRGLQAHTVTFTGEQREDLLPAQSRMTTFRTAGTYRYECRIHPSMQGTVVVQGAATSSSTTSTTRRSTTTSTTQDARGSAITAPPDTSTTTTSTTTTVPTDDTTTTVPGLSPDGGHLAAPGSSHGGGDPDVDGPSALAALLLLATAAAAFVQARGALP